MRLYKYTTAIKNFVICKFNTDIDTQQSPNEKKKKTFFYCFGYTYTYNIDREYSSSYEIFRTHLDCVLFAKYMYIISHYTFHIWQQKLAEKLTNIYMIVSIYGSHCNIISFYHLLITKSLTFIHFIKVISLSILDGCVLT